MTVIGFPNMIDGGVMSTMSSTLFVSMNLGVILNHKNVVRKKIKINSPPFHSQIVLTTVSKHNHLLTHPKVRCD